MDEDVVRFWRGRAGVISLKEILSFGLLLLWGKGAFKSVYPSLWCPTKIAGLYDMQTLLSFSLSVHPSLLCPTSLHALVCSWYISSLSQKHTTGHYVPEAYFFLIHLFSVLQAYHGHYVLRALFSDISLFCPTSIAGPLCPSFPVLFFLNLWLFISWSF